MSSNIVMSTPTLKIKTKYSEKNTWETQARKFTTSKKVNIYFCLLEFSATKIMKWTYHIDKYNNGRYDMIIGRYLSPHWEWILSFIIMSY